MKTKPHSSAPRSQRKAWKAAFRRRETWMPMMQQAVRFQREEGLRVAQATRLHPTRIKIPDIVEPIKPATRKPFDLGRSLAALSGGFRQILGSFKKRALTP